MEETDNKREVSLGYWQEQVSLWFDSADFVTEQVQFLATILDSAPSRRLVEISCTSGIRAAALMALTESLMCTQPDGRLASHLKELAPGLEVHEVTASELGRIATSKSLGAVMCLENSFAFLHSEPEAAQVLEQFADALVDEGFVILDLDNYTRILQNRIRNLPLLQSKWNGEDVLLLRQYEVVEDGLRLYLNVMQRQGEAWTFHTESRRVLPLEQSSVVTALRNAGFSQIRLFGNFHGDEYRPLESERLIVVASRARRGTEG